MSYPAGGSDWPTRVAELDDGHQPGQTQSAALHRLSQASLSQNFQEDIPIHRFSLLNPTPLPDIDPNTTDQIEFSEDDDDDENGTPSLPKRASLELWLAAEGERSLAASSQAPPTFYVCRVPLRQDFFLTLTRPRKRSITAMDVEQCLYFVSVRPSPDLGKGDVQLALHRRQWEIGEIKTVAHITVHTSPAQLGHRRKSELSLTISMLPQGSDQHDIPWSTSLEKQQLGSDGASFSAIDKSGRICTFKQSSFGSRIIKCSTTSSETHYSSIDQAVSELRFNLPNHHSAIVPTRSSMHEASSKSKAMADWVRKRRSRLSHERQPFTHTVRSGTPALTEQATYNEQQPPLPPRSSTQSSMEFQTTRKPVPVRTSTQENEQPSVPLPYRSNSIVRKPILPPRPTVGRTAPLPLSDRSLGHNANVQDAFKTLHETFGADAIRDAMNAPPRQKENGAPNRRISGLMTSIGNREKTYEILTVSSRASSGPSQATKSGYTNGHDQQEAKLAKIIVHGAGWQHMDFTIATNFGIFYRAFRHYAASEEDD